MSLFLAWHLSIKTDEMRKLRTADILIVYAVRWLTWLIKASVRRVQLCCPHGWAHLRPSQTWLIKAAEQEMSSKLLPSRMSSYLTLLGQNIFNIFKHTNLEHIVRNWSENCRATILWRQTLILLNLQKYLKHF